MKKNVKTINVFIQNDNHLNLIKNTFALKSYFRNPENLKVGDNIINVNHYNFSQLVNSQLYGKAIITELKNQ
jgi:hypothetical protein